MDKNKVNGEKMQDYDITKYERPSVATDIVVLCVGQDAKKDNFRKLPEKKLKILLVKRAEEPFKDMWALPGGFVRKEETIEDAAKRELKEETGTDKAYLELCGVFDEKDRDPRGWIISEAFMAIMNTSEQQQMKFCATGDVSEAKWFDVSLQVIGKGETLRENQRINSTEYKLVLTDDDSNTLSAIINVESIFCDYHEIIKYKLVENGGIAFDHAKIITHILMKVRRAFENDIRMVFDFLPESFTLTDLQEVAEIVTDTTLLKPNFRRKIAEYVIATEIQVQNGGHRPAKAYIRNLERFH